MPEKYEKIGVYTSASVVKHTGKSWEKWVQLLNEAGAAHWDHKTTVAYLKKKHKLKLWWQQVVTQGYGIAIGKRIEGQTLKGDYTLTVTKTFPADQKDTWNLLTSKQGLLVWLGTTYDFDLLPKSQFETDEGVFGEVRTMKPNERVRLTWQESDWEKPTVLQIWVIKRKGPKCLLAFTQDKIPTARRKAELRERWQEVTEKLVQLAKSEFSAGEKAPAKFRKKLKSNVKNR